MKFLAFVIACAIVPSVISLDQYVSNSLGDFLFPSQDEAGKYPLTYYYAMDHCKIRGMDILEIRSTEINDFFINELKQRETGPDPVQYWMGITRETGTSQFKYLSDSTPVALTYWSPNSPQPASAIVYDVTCSFNQTHCLWTDVYNNEKTHQAKVVCHRLIEDRPPIDNGLPDKASKIYNFFFN